MIDKVTLYWAVCDTCRAIGPERWGPVAAIESAILVRWHLETTGNEDTAQTFCPTCWAKRVAKRT